MRIVLSNLPVGRADEIADALVIERLAACVNLLPVRSVYRWKGDLCHDEECTALIKVAAHGVDRLVERLVELHPYEVPEIVVLPVETAVSLSAYVQWVRDETAPPNWGVAQGDET